MAEALAGYFGGGGHKFAAGFRTYDVSYDEVVSGLVEAMGNMALVVDSARSEEMGASVREMSKLR